MKRLLALVMIVALLMGCAAAKADDPAVLREFLDYPDVFQVLDVGNAEGKAYSGGDVAGIITQFTQQHFTFRIPAMGDDSYGTGRFTLVVENVHSNDYTCYPGFILTLVSPTYWDIRLLSFHAGDEVYAFPLGKASSSRTELEDGRQVQMIHLVLGPESREFLHDMAAYYRSAGSSGDELPINVTLYGDENFDITLAEDAMMDYNVLVMIGFEIILDGFNHMPPEGHGTPTIKGLPLKPGDE